MAADRNHGVSANSYFGAVRDADAAISRLRSRSLIALSLSISRWAVPSSRNRIFGRPYDPCLVEEWATGREGARFSAALAPDPSKTSFSGARLIDRRRDVRHLLWGEVPVTDNRWELAVVTLVAIAVFFSVWRLVARLIS